MATVNLSPFKVLSYSFYLGSNAVSSSLTGSGSIIKAAVGERLWRGSITTQQHDHQTLRSFNTKLDMLEDPESRLLISDFKNTLPTNYQPGVGPSTGTITTIGANRMTATLTGIPVGINMEIGDYFSYYHPITFHYHTHRITQRFPTSGGGNASVNFYPRLPDDIQSGHAIIYQCLLHATIVPGSLQVASTELDRTTGVSFDWIQVTRA